VNHGYPPLFSGGSEVYTQTLATNLAQSPACEAVEVFSREHDPFRPDFAVRTTKDSLDPKVPVHLVNHAREAPYYRFLSEPIDRAFRGVVDRFKPDVVHFGHLNHLSASLPAIAKASNATVLYTLHDFWLMCLRGQFTVTGVTSSGEDEPWQMCSGQDDRKCATHCMAGRYATGAGADEQGEQAYWTHWVTSRMRHIRQACNEVDMFLSPSVHLMKRFGDAGFLPTSKMMLLPYGFDRRRLSLRRRGSDKEASDVFTFAYIGRHQPTKGIHLLVQAVQRLVETKEHSKFRVLIFGRPDHATTAALQRQCAEAGSEIQERIQWRLEYKNEDIVRDVFNKVDCIVVPSIWDENSPLVIHEAQQCHVPVITADRAGMSELVQHQVNGLLFKHRDSASLAEQMSVALRDPDRLAALGKRGYLHSDDGQVPSIDNHMREIVALYRSLLARRRNNSAAAKSTQGLLPPEGFRNPQFAGLQRLLEDSAVELSSAPQQLEHNGTQVAANVTIAPPAQDVDAGIRKAPWRVTFDTNPDDCNFKCKMCECHSEYSSHQADRKANNIRRRRMDFAVIRKVVEELAPHGLREIIPSTMGEPLQYKQFPDIVDLCRKHNVKLNLTTNGSFPGRGVDKWAELVLPVCSDVKISWNGTSEETQQVIMVGSSLKTQMENLRRFVAARDKLAASGGNRASITLQVTFLEANLQEMPKIVQLAIDTGCDRVKGHHLWAHFAEIKDQDMRRSADSVRRWNQIAEQCRALAANTSVRLENFHNLKMPPPSTAPGSALPSSAHAVADDDECPFLGQEAWVNHEGRFDPCCAPDESRKSLGYFGNTKAKPLLDIWRSKKYVSLYKTYKQKELCKTCTMRRPSKAE
jgi:glycosyltransferase involved in cell wall biosynthesis/MoaA/NifB/PqqE/SkfB family radical SAM enzyme